MGIQINGSNDTIQADDGSLSLAGSVSYEDVTNVTSVGLSTFSSGIHIDDSITHLGDTDTKIRFPAADTITAETGGNERIRITSAGILQLDNGNQITAADTTTYIGLGGGNSTSNGANMFLYGGSHASNASLFVFRTGTSERLRIDSSGNLIIGTTTAATNAKVTVRDAAPQLSLYATPGNVSRITLGDTDDYDIGQIEYSNSDNSMRFTVNASERLRIDSSGRVGIDNVSPGNKLSVSNAGAESFDINPGSVANNNIVLHYNWSGSNYVTAETRAAEHVFEIGTSEAMRINSSGVLTVGTTAAGSNAKFEVASTTGSISSATARINGGSTTSGAINTGASLLFAGHDGANGRDFASLFAGKENGTSGNHAAYLAFGTRVNGGSTTEKMRIDSSGRMGLGTNSPKRQLHIHGGNETVKIQLTNTTTGSANDGEGFQIGIAANGDAFLEQRENSPLIFYTSNTEAMRINSSRRVLLGTTTEGHTTADDLTVSTGGDTGITIRSNSTLNGNIYFSDGTSGADEYRGIVRYAHNLDALDFYSNAQHRMRITSGGQVNIGGNFTQSGFTSQITRNSSESDILCLKGNVHNSFIRFQDTDSTSDFTVGSDDGSGAGAGSFVIYDRNNNAYRFYLNSSGNLGIGAIPSRKLTVGGDINVASGSNIESTSSGGTLRVQGGSTYPGGNILLGGGSGTNDIRFNTTGATTTQTERMRIDSSGHVLINTTSAGAGAGFNTQLAVSGGDTSIFKTSGVGASSAAPLRAWHDAASGDNLLVMFHTDSSLTTRGTIRYDRSLNQVVYNTTSDARLKTNIVNSSSALGYLSQVRVRSFDWIEKGHNRVNFGFIAQELNEVVPGAVSVGDDGEEVVDQWAVDNSKIVPMLTKALQEAIAEIESLKARVTTLEG